MLDKRGSQSIQGPKRGAAHIQTATQTQQACGECGTAPGCHTMAQQQLLNPPVTTQGGVVHMPRKLSTCSGAAQRSRWSKVVLLCCVTLCR